MVPLCAMCVRGLVQFCFAKQSARTVLRMQLPSIAPRLICIECSFTLCYGSCSINKQLSLSPLSARRRHLNRLNNLRDGFKWRPL
uniref:Putative secreted protein n=1 Tax=Anopheles marajoara TaxID=58244 RepID=A0A2M4CAU4_9DIPT